MYGYEAELKLSSDIFSREDAEEALRAAEEMFEACSRLIKGIFSEKRESKQEHKDGKGRASFLFLEEDENYSVLASNIVEFYFANTVLSA